MKNVLTFESWIEIHSDEIDIELAENGADRELCFDRHNEYEKRYEQYVIRCNSHKLNKLSSLQKLITLSMIYSSHFGWLPKVGDYYTRVSQDLELYRIVDEDDTYFYTINCNEIDNDMYKWNKWSFVQDFGINKIYVFEDVLLHT